MDREISEWNGAIDYLNRINDTLKMANFSASNLDLYNWLHHLKIFYREISSVMKEEEKMELYNESIILGDKVNKFLNKRNKRKHKPQPQLMQALEWYEIRLRTIYKKSGLQMRLQEDASRALR